MQKEILTLTKPRGFDNLAVSIEVTEGEVPWKVSDELKTQIIDEFNSRLGIDSIDPVIEDTIDAIRS